MFLLARENLDPWLLLMAMLALATSLWVGLIVRSSHQTHTGAASGPAGLAVTAAFALFVSAMMSGVLTMLLVPLAAFVFVSIALRTGFPALSLPGAAWYAVELLGFVIGGLWIVLYIAEVDLSGYARAAALVGVIFGWALMGVSLLERVAREAVVTHASWREPFRAPPTSAHAPRPRVSIHLPTYAEPPEVVKETMNRLAALDYDNFEVLVCDNNTQDERLWRPLERHARQLNIAAGEERFRFFHVSPLPGAKAGALNYLLGVMDPDAELVAVIDADYQSEPDFLARLAPFFADPEIGYLQTPHDYRDFEGSRYQRACYWEYMPNNKVDMPGIHEYGSAFTIGTMCLIRTRALRAAGGWAEWCLTEDSEVSVRLRALGYRGIYLGETFGRGLVPANFDDYKKQRFRWTAGPVQQLIRHWRLFLPSPYAPPMPGWTKFLEILRCAAPLQALAALGTAVFASIFLIFGTISGAVTPFDIPDLVWTLMPLIVATTAIRTWHRYRLTGCHSIRDMIAGEVARASLTYVVLMAGAAGLSRKPLQWRRTPKFAEEGSLGRAVSAAIPETALGLGGLAAALAIFLARDAIGEELGLLIAIGVAGMAIRFLCAPLVALLGEMEMLGSRQKAAHTLGPLPVD